MFTTTCQTHHSDACWLSCRNNSSKLRQLSCIDDHTSNVFKLTKSQNHQQIKDHTNLDPNSLDLNRHFPIDMTSFIKHFPALVGSPAALQATTSAASLPPRMAPSMLPKNFLSHTLRPRFRASWIGCWFLISWSIHKGSSILLIEHLNMPESHLWDVPSRNGRMRLLYSSVELHSLLMGSVIIKFIILWIPSGNLT